MLRIRRLFAPMLAVLMACGCGGPDAPVPTACDPLAAGETPIALATILGVGRDANGTLYVVDEAGTEDRVFVSSDATLYRQRVTGSGRVGSTLRVYALGDRDPVLTLEIDTSSGPLRMGVVAGPLTTKTFVIGEQGEELTVLSASDVAGLAVRNFPPEVVLEYAATLDDGRVLIVTRPRDEWSYSDFRLFLGPIERVLERPVSSVIRLRDGGSTTIAFDVDGASSIASFPVVFDGTTFKPGPPSLTIGGNMIGITLLPKDAKPEGASYFCD